MSELHLRHWNENATLPLVIPVDVLTNTPTETLFAHIKENSLNAKKWIKQVPAHKGVAIICGSGPSLAESVEEIKHKTGTVFALNAAAKFLNDNNVLPDYQVLIDAKKESLTLLGEATEHLFGSTVDPDAFKIKPNASLFHLQIENDELQELLDEIAPDDYSMITTAVSVGVVTAALAYVMGYRELHFYGLDSSHKDNESHVVRQKMNDVVACMEVMYAGKKYISSLPMKLQAERFMQVASLLKSEGCKIEVHGYGLLPDMYNAPYEDLTEKEKYLRMWSMVSYREYSPAEMIVEKILDKLKPNGKILDFGCGTGRASAHISRNGYDVTLIDFAPNCRDQEAAELPFVELDLTEPIPLRAPYGYCVDVMEHIQPEKVECVVQNIMQAAKRVFFQISTVPDKCGSTIGHDLHLTVHPMEWWAELIERLGHKIVYKEKDETTALFVVERN